MPDSINPSLPSPATLRLAGEKIALVGKLASMPRTQVAQVVATHGGTLQTKPSEATTLLVKGDGARTTDLLSTLPDEVRQLLALGQVTLVDETQLWQRVGLVDESVGVSRLYTPALLAEMVKVESRTIHRWHRRGYLLSVCKVHKLPYFDFSELRVARRLADLLQSGVSLVAIDRQMAELARRVPEVDRPLADLSIVVNEGKMFLRHGNDLAETSGQLLIDFDAEPAKSELATEILATEIPATETTDGIAGLPEELEASPATEACSASEAMSPTESPVEMSPTEMRHAALDLQDEGHPAEALELWRAVLLAGPASAEDHFLAADLLYQLGDLAAARERYYMAIETDEEYDEARANLGCVLTELGDPRLAADAFRGALAHNSDFADAHYHLAHLLEQLEQPVEAREHWQAYLHLAPESSWAEEARERLEE